MTLNKLVKLSILTTIIFMIIFLSGCSGKKYQDYTRSIERTNASVSQTFTAYLETQAEVDKEVIKSLRAEGNTVGIALYSANANLNRQIVMTKFKMKAPEKGLDGYDVANTFVGKTTPSLIRWAGGYLISTEIFGALEGAGSVALNGAGSTYNSNSGNTGSFNEMDLSGESSNLSFDTSQDYSLKGEGVSFDQGTPNSFDLSDNSDNSNEIIE